MVQEDPVFRKLLIIAFFLMLGVIIFPFDTCLGIPLILVAVVLFIGLLTGIEDWSFRGRDWTVIAIVAALFLLVTFADPVSGRTIAEGLVNFTMCR